MSTLPVSAAPGFRPVEDDAHRYQRQTRNAAVTMAVIMCLGVLGGLITAIVIAVSIAHQNSLLNSGTPSPSPTCQSQGGWDWSC